MIWLLLCARGYARLNPLCSLPSGPLRTCCGQVSSMSDGEARLSLRSWTRTKPSPKPQQSLSGRILEPAKGNLLPEPKSFLKSLMNCSNKNLLSTK